MRQAIRWTALGALGVMACSGGEKVTTTPPPPTPTVANIDVTPGTATIGVAATAQLTATPRDAQGAAMSGVTVAWSTSAAAVASVSSSGLVTAVAAGTATITASAGGKHGQAVISVTGSDYGPVVAQVGIGSAGGTVATTDVGLTIPAGALATTSTIQLIRDTISPNAYGASGASASYFVNGLPAGVTVQARVRIKLTGSNSGLAAIGLLRPAIEMGDTTAMIMGLQLIAATDSAGYLVATVPLTGRTSWAGTSPPMFRRAFSVMTAGGSANVFDPAALMADAEVAALINLSRATATSGRYEVWGIGGGAGMQAKVDRTAGYIDQANTALVGMGYNFAFRTAWPVQVYVHQIAANGAFVLVGTWPKDLNQSYIEYNKDNTESPAFPGTVIHELFHLVKSGIFRWNSRADWLSSGWLEEATSTWMSEKHPAIVPPFLNPTALARNKDVFTGLRDGMTASSGYGKAPMIKYVAKRWGDAQVKEMLNLVKGGMAPTTAFLAGIPEDPKLWWPDLLKQHLTGTLYPWVADSLVPKNTFRLTPKLGNGQPYNTGPLAALGVEGELLTRDTAMFGPKYMLPIHLDPADVGFGTILAFQKSAAAAGYLPIAAGDTVLIPGTLLQDKDSILLLLTTTRPVAPYSGLRQLWFHADLSVPEADWYFPTISNFDSTVTASCNYPAHRVNLSMSETPILVWNWLSLMGTWKRSGAGVGGSRSDIHTWAATPAWADSMLRINFSLQSTLTTGSNGDTIRMQAHLKMDTDAHTDESFEYLFTKMRFTADRARPADPLMQVYQGQGKTTVNSFRNDYWFYTLNEFNERTDSIFVMCSGTGTATYKADGTAYTDGVTPPWAPGLARAASLLPGRKPVSIRRTPKSEQP